MSNTLKGIISGFVASLALSAVIVLKSQFHIVSDDLSVMNLLARIAGGSFGAWADHFIIGALVWGMLYAGFESAVTKLPHWLKGLIFSVLAWLFMMVAFMPFVGAGLFGTKMGLMGAIVPLVQHLIYGFVLGVTYGLLATRLPSKMPARSPQT
jgi:hypothetical protein